MSKPCGLGDSMKLYIISEIWYEYDDEYYNAPEYDAGTPVKAYKVRENANAECRRMNEERAKENRTRDYPMELEGDGPITRFYNVVPVEVANESVSYASAREAVQAARETAKEVMQDEIKRQAAELFEKFPDLESFAWTQYTDYFNDGDTCRFHVHSDMYYLDINGERGEGAAYDDPRAEAIGELLDSMDADDMEAAFGDHVKVTIRRSGETEIEEYTEHD
jgi:hypothetical protein